MNAKVPPRLFVIMAAKTHAAIVIRRGPARWTQLISWDTDRDVFENGAWFRGRIYEEKCDLSPDGKLFVYAAFQGNRAGTRYTDSYTAVSRSPWLHALGLWSFGTTYGGGGRFVDNRRLMLRARYDDPKSLQSHPDHPALGLEIVPSRSNAPDVHASSGEIPDAEWSGRDQNNRCVLTKDGCVYARTGGEDRLLVDLNDREPNPQPAPEWATRPLK